MGDGSEIVLSSNHDFLANRAMAVIPSEDVTTPDTTASKPRPKAVKTASAPVVHQEPIQNTGAYTVKTRLQKLEELKAAKLISNSEYKKKRSAILNEL